MKQEVWKAVVGYEGYYEVSCLGRVKSLDRTVNAMYGQRPVRGRLLTAKANKALGYNMVTLSKNRKAKAYYVHRLVAEAFLPNPEHKPMINHKDEDKTNNNISNLEWCTAAYNMSYSHVSEKAWEKCRTPVRKYDLDGNLLAEYTCAEQAAKELGVMPYVISYCCDGKVGSVKGFLWGYATDRGKSKLTRVLKRRVMQKDLKGNVIKQWDCAANAARQTGSVATLITQCCKGKRQTHNGFVWEYYDKKPIVFKGGERQ